MELDDVDNLLALSPVAVHSLVFIILSGIVFTLYVLARLRKLKAAGWISFIDGDIEVGYLFLAFALVDWGCKLCPEGTLESPSKGLLL